MLARFVLLRSGLSRGYLSLDKVPIYKLDSYYLQIPSLVDCKAHRSFLVNNEMNIPPSVISYSLECFVINNLLLDEHWPDICMIVKRQLKTYDRHVASHVFNVAKCMSYLDERNQELWDIIETKLVKEGLYRYLSESQCAVLLHSFAGKKFGSDALIEKLTQEVELHAHSLPPRILRAAIQAFKETGRGNLKFLESLTMQKEPKGNPSIS